MRTATRVCAAAFVMAPLWLSEPASAAPDPAIDGTIGGIYSNACGDRSQLMIRLFSDVLDLERGGVAVKASRVKVSNTPPPGAGPDFKAVVQGDVKGGDGVVLVLTHNAKGLFARVDGNPKSLAPLGAGIVGQQVRHCDPNRNALPGAPPPAAPLNSADLLRDARFKAAWLQALGPMGPMGKEAWLARMTGPAPDLRKVKVGGQDFALAAVCKPHDCADNNTVLLWTPKPGVLHALVHLKGRDTLLGNPSPAMAAELKRLWTQEWRQGK